MLLYFFVLNVIFIPLLNSANVTVSSEQTSSTNFRDKSKPETKLTLETGGKIVTEVPPVLSLANEKSTVLLALDKEFANTNEKKPVKPRKEALLDSAEVDNLTKNITSHVKPVQETEKNATKLLPIDKLLRNNITTKVPEVVKNSTSTSLNITPSKLDSLHKTTVVTEHAKKPTKLVYDDLASDKVNVSPSLPVFKSSSKPALDQIPSPDSKLHLKGRGAEPGMIMPIVITIVVVPAFAVLAYMAVKRGREAWKNRHYKRMDFLLDGMYND